MSYNISKLDAQFLASLMADVNKLPMLDKEVSIDDFSDAIYYEIYLRVAEFFLDSKFPTYNDLKFKFKNDTLLIDIINKIEDEEVINDISIVYNELCENSRKLCLKNIGNYLYSQSSDKKLSSADLISNIESKLLRMNINSSDRVQTTLDIEQAFMKEVQVRAKRFNEHKTIEKVIDLPTGFRRIDELTLGFQRKNTWLIAASTSDGKTQLSVQMCNTLMSIGKKVGYFLLEDSVEQLLTRFISLNTSIPIMNIRIGNLTEKDLSNISKSIAFLRNKLFVDDKTIDINEIVLRAKFLKLKHPDLDLIVMDYINLGMDRAERNQNREQEISSMSKKLLQLAKSCNIPVLVLQQLNTDPDKRGTGLPVTLNDLRESKAPGHDASIATLIHCPDKYNQAGKFSRKHTQVILGKNRYGEVNKIIDLTSYANIGKFVEGLPKEKKNG